FMDLGSFIDRGNHEPVRPGYLAILAVKCELLAVRCPVHERKWPARPTDRTAGGRPDLLVASDRDPLVAKLHRGNTRPFREAPEQMWQLTGEDQCAFVGARNDVAAVVGPST